MRHHHPGISSTADFGSQPGTSDPRTPPEDKSLLQKAYDKVGEVNQKASEQYLAS